MDKLKKSLQEYKNWFLNEYDLKEYEQNLETLKDFVAWIVEKKKFKPYHAYTDFLYWASSRIEFENWPTIVSVNKQLYDSILCGLALSDKPLELLSSIIK